MGRFAFGTVYKVQREHDAVAIRGYLRSIKELGLNTVVVWPAVYWWESRSSGDYPYTTGKRILEQAVELELDVVMELAGQLPALEYAPGFLMKPEYYPTDWNGCTSERGMSYGALNFNHPEVRSLIRTQFRETAAAYRGYPALAGYDLWNETHFRSYDRYTLQRFRDWLQAKYRSIGALNDAWDRAYYDWTQIEFTRWLWASVVPYADYYAFARRNIPMILEEWKAAVREADPNVRVFADNIAAGAALDTHHEAPQDDWAVAETVDTFGISMYPQNAPPGMEPAKRWQILQSVASADPDFWIAEMQTHTQILFNPFSAVEPHELEWWTWEALAHGCKGIIYWKWHPFIKGIQTGSRGLTDHTGAYTLRAHRVGEIAGVLSENAELFNEFRRRGPFAAVLYDATNHDLTKAYVSKYPHAPQSIYLDSIQGAHALLFDLNIPATVVRPKDLHRGMVDPTECPVLFVTNQVQVTAETASGMLDYARRGGRIVVDGEFALLGSNAVLYDSIPGAGFGSAVGAEFCGMAPGGLDMQMTDGTPERLAGHFERITYRLYEQCDAGAGEHANRPVRRTLATFADGCPAAFEVDYGHGTITILASHMWYGYAYSPDPATLGLGEILCRSIRDRLPIVTGFPAKLALGDTSAGTLCLVFNYSGATVSATVTFPPQADAGRRRLFRSVRVLRGGGSAARLEADAGTSRLVATLRGHEVVVALLS